MSQHLVEAEQVEQIKRFLRSYGKPIAAGLLIGLVVVFGWRYWNQREALINAEASSAYEHLLRVADEGDPNVAKKEAEDLISKYSGTPYAQQAALILARQAVYQGNYSEATERLEWVISSAKIPALKQSARLRLARVYIAEKDYQAALNTLATVDDPAYKMAIYEVKGDVLLAKGDRIGAQAAYRAALAEVGKADFTYPLLQMKYDDLTGEDALVGKEMNK